MGKEKRDGSQLFWMMTSKQSLSKAEFNTLMRWFWESYCDRVFPGDPGLNQYKKESRKRIHKVFDAHRSFLKENISYSANSKRRDSQKRLPAAQYHLSMNDFFDFADKAMASRLGPMGPSSKNSRGDIDLLKQSYRDHKEDLLRANQSEKSRPGILDRWLSGGSDKPKKRPGA